MSDCAWCDLTEKDREYLLVDSLYWSVFLADEQDYVGRCILVLKRHCGSIAELTEGEWQDLLEIVRRLEACLKKVLGADLCNWSCLMNSFYKDPAPDPHLHIHVRPRYKNPVAINGNTYRDEEFGHHYSIKKAGQLGREDRREVYRRMRIWLDPSLSARQEDQGPK